MSKEGGKKVDRVHRELERNDILSTAEGEGKARGEDRGMEREKKKTREREGERGVNRLKGEKKERGKKIRWERGVETITHHDPIGDTRSGRGW